MYTIVCCAIASAKHMTMYVCNILGGVNPVPTYVMQWAAVWNAANDCMALLGLHKLNQVWQIVVVSVCLGRFHSVQKEVGSLCLIAEDGSESSSGTYFCYLLHSSALCKEFRG